MGRLPLDPAGWIPSMIAAAALIAGLALAWPWLWAPALAVLAALAGFFRDPERAVPARAGAVVAPADGLVDTIAVNRDPERGEDGGPMISIFLSVLDVHVNRAPCPGTIESTRHQPGRFMNAMKPHCAQSNECNWIFMRDAGGRRVTVRQIAGLIARRIVCRVAPGEMVERGQRIGIIRFGSRTELYLPAGSKVDVRIGQRVKGASTIVAWMPE